MKLKNLNYFFINLITIFKKKNYVINKNINYKIIVIFIKNIKKKFFINFLNNFFFLKKKKLIYNKKLFLLLSFLNNNKLNNNKNFNFFSLINFFIINYVEIQIFNNIYVNYYNLGYIINNNNIIFKFKNYILGFCKTKIQNNLINLNFFIDCLIISFYIKDSFSLCKFIKKTLESVDFKNHRKILNFLKFFFLFSFKILKELFVLRGFKFYFSGKIGVGGNSKKRILKFNSGKISLSDKNLKLNFNKNIIKTKTGVLGFDFFLFF